MKQVRLSFLLSFLPFFLFSQNAKLVGRVVDEKGEGVISANVVIDASKGQATVSDFDGNYELTVPVGSYEVTYRFVGKEEVRQKITLADGEKKIINVTLKEKEKLMDVVVVTGSKYEKRLSEETVSMDVLKGSTLSNQNITDLSKGIQKVPGVTMADGQVNIRGGSGWSYGAGSRVLVLIDDLPLLTADAADAKWSFVPMENLDQVEVIKGAASALYGSSALNGIINVRTAYPTDEPYSKVSTYAGFYEGPTKTPNLKWWGGSPQYFNGVNFVDRRKIGQVDFALSGAYNNDKGYLDSSDGIDARLTAKIRYRVKKVQGLNFGINMSGYISWGKIFFLWNGLGKQGYEPYPGTITKYTDYRSSIDPFISYSDSKDNRFSFKTRIFNAQNNNSTGQGSNPTTYYNEFQYQKILKKIDMNIVTGAVVKYDNVTPPPNSYKSLFGKANELNTSVYAQVDKKFFKKLNVTLGARYEYFLMKKYDHYLNIRSNGVDTAIIDNTYNGTDSIKSSYYVQTDQKNSSKDLKYPLFRLGLNYQAAEATFIRASFGQGFRYPTIAERYVSTAIGPLSVFSNPNLQSEKGFSAELGFKQGFKLGKSGNWLGYADVAGFLNQYSNMMEFNFGQFGPSADWNNFNKTFGLGFASQNVGNTRILGTELIIAMQGKFGNGFGLDIVAGYTYIDPRSIHPNDTLKLFNSEGKQLVLDPTSITNLGYNNPNKQSYISYALTSSANKNVLKYRNRHTLKADITLSWKKFEINNNVQYASYMESVDYAFVSPIFVLEGGAPFQALIDYRKQKESVQIGHGRGDIVWNLGIGFKPIEKLKINFLVKNLLNWEYTLRPAIYEAPRNYTLQLSYTFH